MTTKATVQSPTRPILKKEEVQKKFKRKKYQLRIKKRKKDPTEISRLLVLYYIQRTRTPTQECKSQRNPPMTQEKSRKEEKICWKCSRKGNFNCDCFKVLEKERRKK